MLKERVIAYSQCSLLACMTCNMLMVLHLHVQAAKLSWNPNDTNIVFHVLDEPGHGKEFNDTYIGEHWPDWLILPSDAY